MLLLSLESTLKINGRTLKDMISFFSTKYTDKQSITTTSLLSAFVNVALALWPRERSTAHLEKESNRIPLRKPNICEFNQSNLPTVEGSVLTLINFSEQKLCPQLINFRSHWKRRKRFFSIPYIEIKKQSNMISKQRKCLFLQVLCALSSFRYGVCFQKGVHWSWCIIHSIENL